MTSVRKLRALILEGLASGPTTTSCGVNVADPLLPTGGAAGSGGREGGTTTSASTTTDGTTSTSGTTSAGTIGTTASATTSTVGTGGGQDGDVQFCGCGRPFVVGGEARTATGATRGDWLAKEIEALAQHETSVSFAIPGAWMRDALLEHASIASFAKLTLELMALGAPPELIAASQRASLDEIEHARLCFALASRYAKTNLGPSELPMGAFGETPSLVDLAVATVREGCIAETLAALVAAERARVARRAEAKTALRRIARDEGRHAALAWQVVRWALEVGGAAVRDRVKRAFTDELAQIRSRTAAPDPTVALDVWHAHGLLMPAEELELMRRGAIEVVEACVADLGVALEPAPRSTPPLA